MKQNKYIHIRRFICKVKFDITSTISTYVQPLFFSNVFKWITNCSTLNCLQGLHLTTDTPLRAVIKSLGCSVVAYRANYKYVSRAKSAATTRDKHHPRVLFFLLIFLLCWCWQKLMVENSVDSILIYVLYIYVYTPSFICVMMIFQCLVTTLRTSCITVKLIHSDATKICLFFQLAHLFVLSPNSQD